MSKRATPDSPIQDILAARWSPYGFDERAVPSAELRSLFEAARWSASSYNEQPWNYIVATKSAATTYQKILSCLAVNNQAWAKAAPVLALGVVKLQFTHNGKDNRAAVHDLGLAAGNLLAEATQRKISVHQMIGLDPEKARSEFSIPQGYEVWTAIAIGYQADPTGLPDALRERDTAPRTRKTLSAFVFSGTWGTPAPFVKP
jgi:nitroreductase